MQFLKEGSGNGSKMSFGRLSAFLVIVFGLMIIGGSVTMEYYNPSHAITVNEPMMSDGVVTVFETQIPVPRPNWEGYTNFLQWGITPLAFLLFGGGKLAGVAQIWAKNGKG